MPSGISKLWESAGENVKNRAAELIFAEIQGIIPVYAQGMHREQKQRGMNSADRSKVK